MARRSASLSRRLVADFTGGWNAHDDIFLLEDNESPECHDITLDPRGKIVKRLGLTKYNATELGTAAFTMIYYSEALELLIVQQGTNLYKSTGDGNFTSLGITLPTSNRVGMCDFLDKVVIIVPDAGVNGGVHTYDGTNYSAKIAGSPAGAYITPWHNYLVSAGDPALPVRVTRSDLGAFTWTVATGPPVKPAFADIRDEDDSEITGLLVAQRLDSEGRPGLLAFKRRGLFRIHASGDGDFGAYTLIGHDAGAFSSACYATSGERIVMVNEDGIWLTDGMSTPVLVSTKAEPLFDPLQLSYGQLRKACVGVYRERFLVSMPRVGSGVNNITLEYDPADGWIVPHLFGVASFATWRKNDERLFGAAVADGYVYNVFEGGSDDGAPINALWVSKPFLLNTNGDARLRRVRITGRGEFDFFVKRDLEQGAGKVFPLGIISISNMEWNDFYWNNGTNWGPDRSEDSVDVYSLGVAREFQFVFRKEGTTSALGEKLLGVGGSPEIGAFAVSAFRLDYETLGGS